MASINKFSTKNYISYKKKKNYISLTADTAFWFKKYNVNVFREM